MNAPRTIAAIISFWVLVTGASLCLIQMTTGEVNLSTYGYSPRGWTFGAALACCLLVISGVLACFMELSGTGEHFIQRMLGDARIRLLAAAPAIILLPLGLCQHYCDKWFFAFIPAAILITGWSCGRLANVFTSPNRTWSSRRWLAVVVVAALLAAACWTWQLEQETSAGHMGAPDVGLFATRLVHTWNWKHPFSDESVTPPFYDHFNPAFYLLCPLVSVFNPVSLLHIVQCLSLALPTLIWFAVGRKSGMSPPSAAFAAIAWLLIPSVSQLTSNFSYGFHPISIAACLMAAGLYLASNRRWWGLAVCMLLAMTLRETVAISFAGVGLWMLFSSDKRKPGIVILAASVAYFCTTVWLILPGITGGQAYLGPTRFGHLGDTALQILMSPVLRPGEFWPSLVSLQSLAFVGTLLACVAMRPPFVGGRRLIMLLPEGVFLLLWQDPNVKNMAFQYHTVVLVQLFWISIYRPASESADDSSSSLGKLRSILPATPRAVAGMLFASAFCGSLLLGHWPHTMITSEIDRQPARPHLSLFATKCVDLAKDGVAATPRAAVFLVRSDELFVLPDDIPFDSWPDTFLLDYGDDWIRTDLETAMPALWNWQNRITNAGYHLIETENDIALFSRSTKRVTVQPIHENTLPADALARREMQVAPGLTQLGWRMKHIDASSDPAWITFDCYLRVDGEIKADWASSIQVQHRAWPGVIVALSCARPAGDFSHPSSTWQVGEIIRETASMPWMIVDPPRLDDINVHVAFVDLTTGKPVTAAE